MVNEILTIVCFTFASCLSQNAAPPHKKFDDIEAAVFSRRVYPEPGDIPVLNRKVFRGTRVSVAEHPYVVSIRRLHAHYLTGAILGMHTVVTVAHPIYNVSPTELGVVTGETYCDRGAAYMTVLLIITHEDFDPYTLKGDLALLRVYEAIFAKPTQKPIVLLTDTDLRPLRTQNMKTTHKRKQSPQKAFVTGWGRCDWTGNELCFPRSTVFFPDEKLDPLLRTVSFNHSKLKMSPYCVGYERHRIPLWRDRGMLCVGPAREAEPLASCLGAPGAPLTVLGRLAGLLSWGFGCGYARDLPLVYTDMRFYAEWIQKNLKILNSLDTDEVSELYIATKAYVMQQWLMLTSEQRPAEIPQREAQLRVTDLDDHLIYLAGNITDFRNYAYGGIFSEQKVELYARIRAESDKKLLLEKIAIEALSNREPPKPFLNKKLYYVSNDSVVDLGHRHTKIAQ